MSFEEDGVNTLGEVGLGGPGRVCRFGKSRWGSWVHIWQWSNFLWDLGIGLEVWGGRR